MPGGGQRRVHRARAIGKVITEEQRSLATQGQQGGVGQQGQGSQQVLLAAAAAAAHEYHCQAPIYDVGQRESEGGGPHHRDCPGAEGGEDAGKEP